MSTQTLKMTKVKSARTPLQKLGTGVAAVLINAVLLIFSISCIFPLVWMFYSSLKLKRQFNADIIGLPTAPTFENYIRVLTNKDYHLGSSMLNSVRVTVISLFFIVLFGFVIGYILARVPFKLNRLLYVLFLMGLLIPVHSLLVPIYVVFNSVGMSNQWYTLIIPYKPNCSHNGTNSRAKAEPNVPGGRLYQGDSGRTGRGCGY